MLGGALPVPRVYRILNVMSIGVDISKGGKEKNGSLLHEVPCQEGNQEPQGHNLQERQAGDSGSLPDLWHLGVQNREIYLEGEGGAVPKYHPYSVHGQCETGSGGMPRLRTRS